MDNLFVRFRTSCAGEEAPSTTSPPAGTEVERAPSLSPPAGTTLGRDKDGTDTDSGRRLGRFVDRFGGGHPNFGFRGGITPYSPRGTQDVVIVDAMLLPETCWWSFGPSGSHSAGRTPVIELAGQRWATRVSASLLPATMAIASRARGSSSCRSTATRPYYARMTAHRRHRTPSLAPLNDRFVYRKPAVRRSPWGRPVGLLAAQPDNAADVSRSR